MAKNRHQKNHFNNQSPIQVMITEYMFCNLSIWVVVKVNYQYLTHPQGKGKCTE
jgi:CRISPR/Cas system-associated exonuclease Cas4 (RecB family)